MCGGIIAIMAVGTAVTLAATISKAALDAKARDDQQAMQEKQARIQKNTIARQTAEKLRSAAAAKVRNKISYEKNMMKAYTSVAQGIAASQYHNDKAVQQKRENALFKA